MSRSEQFYRKNHCDSRKLYLAEDFTPKADIGFSSKMLREFECIFQSFPKSKLDTSFLYLINFWWFIRVT